MFKEPSPSLRALWADLTQPEGKVMVPILTWLLNKYKILELFSIRRKKIYPTQTYRSGLDPTQTCRSGWDLTQTCRSGLAQTRYLGGLRQYALKNLGLRHQGLPCRVRMTGKMCMQLISLITTPSKRSKEPPINVTVTVAESLGVNEPSVLHLLHHLVWFSITRGTSSLRLKTLFRTEFSLGNRWLQFNDLSRNYWHWDFYCLWCREIRRFTYLLFSSGPTHCLWCREIHLPVVFFWPYPLFMVQGDSPTCCFLLVLCIVCGAGRFTYLSFSSLGDRDTDPVSGVPLGTVNDSSV